LLALPPGRDKDDLIRKAFDRGPKGFGTERIPNALYEELRSNALFPVDPAPAGVRKDVAWSNFSKLKADDSGSPVLLLGPSGQWASYDFVEEMAKPAPTFRWQITNRYQEELFADLELRQDGRALGGFAKALTFGRSDPALLAEGKVVRFHPESEPQG